MSKSTSTVKLDAATLDQYTARDGCPETLATAQEVAQDLYRHQNELDLLVAVKNEDVREIEDKYAAQIELLKGRIDREVHRLKLFAVRHREQFFGTSQRWDCAGVTLSFRKSPGKVGFLPGRKEADVVDAIMADSDPEFRVKYLSFRPTLDKSEILYSLSTDHDMTQRLNDMGLFFAAEESFSAKPAAKVATQPAVTAK